MDDYVLYPPNCHWISDKLIGEVVAKQTRPISQTGVSDSIPKQTTHPCQATHVSVRTCAQQTSTSSDQEPSLDFSSAADQTQLATDHKPISSSISSGNYVSSDIAERVRILHRQRRRRIQQRYRKKISDNARALKEKVTALREEVQQLEKMCSSVPLSRDLNKTMPLEVVVEYFRLFRNGFKPTVSVSELCSFTGAKHLDKAHVQTQFFQAITAPNALFNAGYGVEVALEDWRLVSLHLVYDLERVERGGGGFVIAHMNGITTIMAKMLRMAFPDFNDNDEEDKWASLAEKLLGQRLVVPSGICFHFVDTNNRVVSARYEADMMTPLLKLL